MKRLVIFVVLILTLTSPCLAAIELYVSAKQGNDKFSGRFAAPNAASTDGPFATLERARDALRTAVHTRSKSGRMPGGATIWIRGGAYYRDTTFELLPEDSGTTSAPIVYRAYGEERPRLIGGKEIPAGRPVTDPAVQERLSPEARAHVKEASNKHSCHQPPHRSLYCPL